MKEHHNTNIQNTNYVKNSNIPSNILRSPHKEAHYKLTYRTSTLLSNHLRTGEDCHSWSSLRQPLGNSASDRNRPFPIYSFYYLQNNKTPSNRYKIANISGREREKRKTCECNKASVLQVAHRLGEKSDQPKIQYTWIYKWYARVSLRNGTTKMSRFKSQNNVFNKDIQLAGNNTHLGHTRIAGLLWP